MVFLDCEQNIIINLYIFINVYYHVTLAFAPAPKRHLGGLALRVSRHYTLSVSRHV